MTGFTVNLRVAGWPCLVVGAGAIALPKAQRLIEGGAVVTIVAPDAPEALAGATILRRPVKLQDLDGMRLAIFGTHDPALNRELFDEASRRGILAAAVDDREAADFFMPALLRRGDLEVAVSTGGGAPAYAVWVRDRIAALVDAAYGQALDWLTALRRERLRALPLPERKRVFRALLALDLPANFRTGSPEDLEAKAASILDGNRDVSA